jgi:hypothetical protein
LALALRETPRFLKTQSVAAPAGSSACATRHEVLKTSKRASSRPPCQFIELTMALMKLEFSSSMAAFNARWLLAWMTSQSNENFEAARLYAHERQKEESSHRGPRSTPRGPHGYDETIPSPTLASISQSRSFESASSQFFELTPRARCRLLGNFQKPMSFSIGEPLGDCLGLAAAASLYAEPAREGARGLHGFRLKRARRASILRMLGSSCAEKSEVVNSRGLWRGVYVQAAVSFLMEVVGYTERRQVLAISRQAAASPPGLKANRHEIFLAL